MPINTLFNPKTLAEFTKDHLEFAGKSLFFSASAGVVTEHDLTATEDYLLTAGDLLVEGGSIDDQIFLQVVHPIYGVVKEFISGYRVAPDSVRQLDLQIQYPSKLLASLSIRCKYIAADVGTDRKVTVNLFLHRILE